jgi:hypothetical protein
MSQVKRSIHRIILGALAYLTVLFFAGELRLDSGAAMWFLTVWLGQAAFEMWALFQGDRHHSQTV